MSETVKDSAPQGTKGRRGPVKNRGLPLLLALLLLAGCAPQPAQSEGYAPKEEDRLVVYTAHKEEVYWPIVKEFEERTGIWVEVVPGGTNELLERIRRESGSPAADVMFGGGVESLTAYGDCFAPYRCTQAEELQPRFRDPEDRWTPFSALPVVLVYNTRLMRPGQEPDWDDLLSPALRGRIAFADPSVSGSSFTALETLMLAEGEMEEDALLRTFAENLDGQQLGGSGEVLRAVADGTALVGVTLEETALKSVAAGDNIALVYPKSGTSCVPDAGALILGAPHEENAKRFLDFTVSHEVQQLLTEKFCRRSVRGDVESSLVPLEDIQLLHYDVEKTSESRDAVLMTWAFYLGGEKEP